MAIAALPTPPSRSDPTNFATRGDAFMAALPTFATEANALQADVNTKQSTASAAATTATTQADIATAAATTATTQADIATSAANSAVASYDLFDDRFLGAKTSDPLVDNDGNALQTGAAYFNTTNNTTKLWNGSSWQVAFGNLTGDFTVVREPKTATAGQTAFNLTNSYSVGTNSIMVYLNGVRLMPADYTETNATTVTLGTAAALNDELLFEIGVVSTGTTAVAGLTSFNPTAGISATNVQAALAELDSEKVNLAGNDQVLSATTLKDTAYSYYNSGSTSAFNYTNGSYQRWSPTGSVTLSVTNWPVTGTLGELLIEGVNLGAATITWPTVNWIKSDGTTTTTFSSNGVTLQSSGTDFVVLWTRDAGTTVYGKVVR